MAKISRIEERRLVDINHYFLPYHNFFTFLNVCNIPLLHQILQSWLPRRELERSKEDTTMTTRLYQCFSAVHEVASVMWSEFVLAGFPDHSDVSHCGDTRTVLHSPASLALVRQHLKAACQDRKSQSYIWDKRKSLPHWTPLLLLLHPPTNLSRLLRRTCPTCPLTSPLHWAMEALQGLLENAVAFSKAIASSIPSPSHVELWHQYSPYHGGEMCLPQKASYFLISEKSGVSG